MRKLQAETPSEQPGKRLWANLLGGHSPQGQHQANTPRRTAPMRTPLREHPLGELLQTKIPRRTSPGEHPPRRTPRQKHLEANTSHEQRKQCEQGAQGEHPQLNMPRRGRQTDQGRRRTCSGEHPKPRRTPGRTRPTYRTRLIPSGEHPLARRTKPEAKEEHPQANTSSAGKRSQVS